MSYHCKFSDANFFESKDSSKSMEDDDYHDDFVKRQRHVIAAILF
jgi:hypothetical protein